MKPQYLNSADKQALTMLAACAGFLEQSLEGIRHVPKAAQSDMKRAKSFAWKAVQATLEPLEEKVKRQLLNIIKDVDIGIVSKKDVQAWKQSTDMYVSGKEFVHRMAEITMAARCATCDGSCRDTCPLYESYVHFEVPEFDPNHRNCPYSML